MFKQLSGMTLLVAALAGDAGAQDLYLADVHIVDPAKQEIRRGNLLVLAGRIVGEPPAAPADFKGRTVNASGKWVIPGLVDLHTHSYGNMAPGNTFDTPGRCAPGGKRRRVDGAGPQQICGGCRDRSSHPPGSSIESSYPGWVERGW